MQRHRCPSPSRARRETKLLSPFGIVEARVEAFEAALELKLVAQAKLNDPNALTALEAKFKERIDGLNQTFKAHLLLTEQH